jgi:leader peptidase (prepilin peptidase)/N-methyltransferase
MKKLNICELVPVASFIALRGRCRSCGSGIPLRFFIVEMLTPLLYLGLYKRIGMGPSFFVYAYLVSLLFYLSLVDIDIGSVSMGDIAAVYAGACVFLFLCFRGIISQLVLQSIFSFGLCAGLISLSMLLLYLIRGKRGLGVGDVLTLPGIALYFEMFSMVRILLFSAVLGIVVGVLLILLNKVERGFKFPLLPFVTGGVCIEILVFYSNIL